MRPVETENGQHGITKVRYRIHCLLSWLCGFQEPKLVIIATQHYKGNIVECISNSEKGHNSPMISFQHASLSLIYFLKRLCMSTGVQVPSHGKECQAIWVWNHRWFWAAQCGCWKPNWGLLLFGYMFLASSPTPREEKEGENKWVTFRSSMSC